MPLDLSQIQREANEKYAVSQGFLLKDKVDLEKRAFIRGAEWVFTQMTKERELWSCDLIEFLVAAGMIKFTDSFPGTYNEVFIQFQQTLKNAKDGK